MDYLPKYDLEIEIDPDERFELGHDFSVLMDEASGESIDSVVITATKVSDGSNASSLLISASSRIVDEFGMIAYGIDGSNGEDGEDYRIQILASTNRMVGATSPRPKANHLIMIRSR